MHKARSSLIHSLQHGHSGLLYWGTEAEGEGTRAHPRKVRLGNLQAEKLKLYLYKLAKRKGLFYIYIFLGGLPND